MNAAVLYAKLHERRRRDDKSRRVGEAELQRTERAGCAVRDAGEFIEGCEDLFDPLVVARAEFVEHQVLARPIEQRSSHLVLELGEVLADARLGHAQDLGGIRRGPVVHDSRKHL